ncbi:hypothetical protein BBJ29_001379 [Phytophthora kernoviae]|uniref:START domain-containing protein n=1 Tax=Phytophthora kernoviae TaxID=325452 RepID=A0A3F2RZ76_9STRA|nr:hypothetical protein BBJ29_001379 [Phytophthora kernoviae]RLN67171.1 hypothetical protein BBP00_00001791 [Phytophthora kernoviae]
MPRTSSPSLPPTASYTSTAPSTPRGHKLQFPLPDDFFPTVSLSLTQVQQYEAQVEELANKAVEACNEHESQVAGFGLEDKRWTEIAHDTDISIARRKQRGVSIIRTFGTVTVDYRRFVDFFSSETSEQLFAWNQFFYGCAVDAVVLCNMDLRKPDKQASLGIKWTCLQPSMLTRKRDECFLEYTVFRKDAHDRDVAVIVHMPIDIPECPPLPHEMKTKREKTTTVVVVRAADDHSNATQLFALSQCNNRALAASTKYCRKLLKALKDISLSADAKRIATAIKTPGRSSIMEVIDTKDMLPDSELQKQLRSQQPPASATPTEDAEDDVFNEFQQTSRARYTSTPVAPTDLPPRASGRRTRSTDQGKVSDLTRSLDQCIAEQNELLKQVLSASRGLNADPPARAKASSVSYNIYDEDHDDGVYEL